MSQSLSCLAKNGSRHLDFEIVTIFFSILLKLVENLRLNVETKKKLKNCILDSQRKNHSKTSKSSKSSKNPEFWGNHSFSQDYKYIAMLYQYLQEIVMLVCILSFLYPLIKALIFLVDVIQKCPIFFCDQFQVNLSKKLTSSSETVQKTDIICKKAVTILWKNMAFANDIFMSFVRML